ncbi:MAG TPA: BamA/TamA family outer membrane protein, partial [Candidatus Kryptonia bacterium]|nr:BamA/TamA family outer membrane protein [Candidatus Kryptonia bacterium]
RRFWSMNARLDARGDSRLPLTSGLCFDDGMMPRWARSIMRSLLAAMVWLPAAPVTAQGFLNLGKNATIIPLPEIITDPNEGTTFGFLPVILVTDDDQSIRRIIAPDVRFNDITGVYPMFRLFEYPSENQKLLLQAGKATKIGEYFEALYSGERLFRGWLDLNFRAFHENDPFERFFGFGNDTVDGSETNYTGDTTIVVGAVGLNLPYHLQAGTQIRVRDEHVRRGGVNSVAQLVDNPTLTGTPGIEPATIVGQRFGFRYDTRDAYVVPTEGSLADGGIEVVDEALGSSASYVKYSLEGRSFQSLRRDKTFILAFQGVLDYVQGGDRAPFYERSRLGGVSSLRAFGSNRFVDNHRCFLRVELRTNVWEPAFLPQQFNVRGHLELAPFLEMGRVFNSSRTFPLSDPHVDGGVGLRAVVAPQVVAYVDFGTSGSGPSVFTGVDYPF